MSDPHTHSGARLLGQSALAAGTLCLALAMAGYGSPAQLAGLSLPELARAVRIWRWISLLSSWVLLPTGVFLLSVGSAVSDGERRGIVRNALMFLAAVAGLALLNHVLIASGHYYGTAHFFPISVFRGPEMYVSGIAFGVLMPAALWAALTRSSRLGTLHVWLISLGLIVLGNLAQGSVHQAFHIPLAGSGLHYYHEAVGIDDWSAWLRGFTRLQESMGTHAKTHPPFAVLLHYLLMRISGGGVLPLAALLTVLSSLAVPIVRAIMRELGSSSGRAAEFALLFAVIPAFNIYAAVSLDAVIVTLVACMLLGLVRILKRGLDVTGIILVAIGMILANALTFAGTILIVVTGVVAVAEASEKRYGVPLAFGVACVAGVVALVVVRAALGYDHIGALLTAMRLEAAKGGSLLHLQGAYVWTRAEDIFEMALFLSAGVLAVLFRPRVLGLRLLDVRDRIGRLPLAMLFVLAIFLVIGTHRTGETARACLWCYPFLLLLLRHVDRAVLRALAYSAAVQTAVMQVTGAFFW